MAQMLVPGAVVLRHTPDFVFEKAFGTRNIGAGPGDPICLDDHFRAGSNTKTMTGTIVLQLVADPAVDLGGTLPGYQSLMGYDPDGDQTLIVATNLSGAPDGKLTANELAMVVLGFTAQPS